MQEEDCIVATKTSAYMPYLTLWDKISQNSAYLTANSQNKFQISQNF